MSLAQAQAYIGTLPATQRARAEITRWYTALDNYNPVREHTNGIAVSFTLPTTRETGYVLFSADKLPLASDSVYVVQTEDNRVTAMFPAAWHGASDELGARVTLHPYSSTVPGTVQAFGPKRSYHIRLVKR